MHSTLFAHLLDLKTRHKPNLGLEKIRESLAQANVSPNDVNTGMMFKRHCDGSIL